MLAACIAAIGVCGVAAAPAGATSGFVEADGARFALDGRPWRPIGYNQYRLTSQPGGYVCDPGYGAISDASLGRRLDEMRDAGANTVRTWFFQSYYEGAGWAPFDRVLRAAAARGLRVVPVLVNHYPDCEPPSGGAKSIGFYQSAFRSPGYGYPLSFKAYARMVAEHYAADRTVAFWQLVNEAEACGSDGPAALRSFAGEMRRELRAVDTNHLVSLGTIGASQCGTTGDDYRTVHEVVDVCEVHDYGAPQTAMPGDDTNGIARRVRQCTDLGKPIFVGEAGIQSDVNADGGSSGTTTAATLQRRAELLRREDRRAAAGRHGRLSHLGQDPREQRLLVQRFVGALRDRPLRHRHDRGPRRRRHARRLDGTRRVVAARAVMPIPAGLIGRLHVDLGAAARRRVARSALPGTLRIVVVRGTTRRAKTVRITILPPRRPFRRRGAQRRRALMTLV